MDLQEWDLLSDEGFIDQENEFSPKLIPNTPTLIDMNYFQKFSDPPKKSGVIIPVPIQFDKTNNQDETFEEIPEEEVTKFPIESTTTKFVSNNQQMIKEFADHQETITTQISFKKLKENEFVDMKMDSPKSLNRGLLPQIDMGTYQFEEKAKAKDEEEEESEIPNNTNEKNSMIENKNDHNNNNNVWKWAMTGIGALCSFGFAAATVSLIVLGNRHRESKKQAELHFQIYSHDKRFKQVVRHATKINEALTAMRGAPVTRAHITIGGYHESL